MVENAGIPFITWVKDHVGKIFKLLISVGCHFHVNQSIDHVEWDDVTFECVNVLRASNLHRTIVHLVLVVFDLPTGVYGAVTTVVSILSEYYDDSAALCDNAGGCVNELESIELVIANAGGVDLTVVREDNSGVTAEDTSVSSSIYQGSTLVALNGAVVDVIACARRF